MGFSEIQSRSLNGGLVTGLPAFQIGVAESPDCENVDPSDPRGATSRPGSSLYFAGASIGSGTALGTGTVVSGYFPWTRNNATAYHFVAYATTIFSVDSATAYAVKIGMATDSIMQAAPLNDMLVVVASGLFPQISSAGSTLASITAGTFLPALARLACPYANRVWLAGNPTAPNTIYSCKTNSPEDWTTANNASSITVGDGDGDTIKGLVGTKRAMFILKRTNLYALIGDSPFNYEVNRIRQIGCVGDYAYCTDGEGCFFASDDGIYYASGLSVGRVSDPIRPSYYNDITDKSTIAMECKGNKLFVFYKSASTSAQNDKAYVIDVARKMPDGGVRGIWARYLAQPYQVAKTARDNTLYAATNASTVQLYKLDTGSSGAIACYWNTPDLDFGDPFVVKNLVRYFIHVAPPTATATLTVQWFCNGTSTGSSYALTIGTTASYAMPQAGPLAISTITGNYLRMKISWTGQQTVYGFKVYADMRVAGDVPRR